YEMMEELYEVLSLKSIAMIGSEDGGKTTITLSVPETKKSFFEALVSKKDPYNSNLYCEFMYEESLFYCFQLSGFGHIVIEPKEAFHPLFLTELNHIVHFVADYFSAISDRNEKMQLEIELQKEKTLLRTIIDAIPETIAFKDMNETYQLTNRRTNMEYTARFESIEGKTISDVYPEHERPVVRALDEEVIKTKQIVRREVQMLTDHGYVNYDTIRTPVYDENQELIGIVSIGRDISESVHMKETLKRNSAFQELLVKIATNFINIDVKDFDFVINEALEQIGKFIQADRSYVFTYDFIKGVTTNTHEWCNEGVSHEIDNLQDLPIEEFVTDWVDYHKQGKEVYIPNVENLDHDSVLYQILSSQNIRSVISVPFMSEGKLIGFVGFDDVKDDRFWNDYEIGLLKVLAEILTNLFVRKEREEELIQARIQAEKANEAKTDFLANMSHEIRTPLSGIYNSYYLLNTTELNREQVDYIDIGYSSVESLSVIVNSILDLSKIEAEKLELYAEPCNLENELYKIIRMQTLSAEEKNIQLSFYFDYKINKEVLLDSPKLRQIILNLVSNAIKFTQQGSVELKVELLEKLNHQYLVEFSVIDTGIGISKDNISKITNKFFQVDSTVSKKYSGTGLGLTIANGLIELFGGKLEITSIENHGSTFSFAIPIAYSQEIETKYNLIQNKKILLITDDESPCLINRIFTSMSANATQIYPEFIHNLYLSKTKYDIIVINSRCSLDFQYEINKMKESVASKQPLFMLCCSNFSSEQRDKYEGYGFNVFIDSNTTRDHIYGQIATYLDKTYHEKDVNLDDFSNHFITLHQQKILVVDDNKLNRKALEIILSKHG
ncbi:MAG: ATP-binding protein, partial [Candidatus Izemoplasmatales bacterium]